MGATPPLVLVRARPGQDCPSSYRSICTVRHLTGLHFPGSFPGVANTGGGCRNPRSCWSSLSRNESLLLLLLYQLNVNLSMTIAQDCCYFRRSNEKARWPLTGTNGPCSNERRAAISTSKHQPATLGLTAFRHSTRPTTNKGVSGAAALRIQPISGSAISRRV